MSASRARQLLGALRQKSGVATIEALVALAREMRLNDTEGAENSAR